MDTEPPRLALAIYSLCGSIFFAMFHLATSLWAGQPVAVTDVIKAFANMVFAIVSGFLVAYALGPAIGSYFPAGELRDPHVVGFVVGALTWEAAPWFFRYGPQLLRRFGKEKR